LSSLSSFLPLPSLAPIKLIFFFPPSFLSFQSSSTHRDYNRSPPRRRRRGSPSYDTSGGGADALLDEIDSEARSVFVSQIAGKLTSRDLGAFFEDKLGEGTVRDARIVTDRVSRRSKG